MINPDSVAYWSKCLYESDGFFSSDNTREAVNAAPEVLRKYATGHRGNALTPYGDEYHTELNQLLRPGLDVLEFGAGPGIDAWYMASHGARVTACDIVPTNVMVLRRLLEPDMGTGVLLTSYTQLLELGTFDLVYSHGCLHHIKNVQEAIFPLTEVIRPGGHALIMVYTNAFYPYENRHPEGPYTRGYSEEEVRHLFLTLTCVSTRIFMNGTFMWALFKKDEL